MKREDFKEILPVHIESCKEIIKQEGNCEDIECEGCPFSCGNTDKYDCEGASYKVMTNKSEEFIKLFSKDFEPNIEAAIDSTTEFLRDSKEQEVDNVNQPNHYKLDGLDVEVLDVIKATLSKEQFEGFLHGNVIKYILRTNKKNGVEDLNKAHKYLGWLIDSKNGLKLNK